MISYRTLLFGTIAVMSAAAPAYADSAAAVPAPIHTMDSAAAVPAPIHTMDSAAAVPKAQAGDTTTATTHSSFANTLYETFVQFEQFVLRISL